MVELQARPESLTIDIATTTLLINDMQNAFCSKGGYLDRVGFDISAAGPAIAGVASVLASARQAGVHVIHTENGFAPDLHDIPAGSPWHVKSPALRYMRAHPETVGTILTEGTWDFAIIDALKPLPGEIVMRKTRPSCFAGTNLEILLRSWGTRTLIVVGIACNVGVEWTLREAMSREYYGVMIEDATMPAGPAYLLDASIFNVETFIGWVTDSQSFATALKNIQKR